VSRKVKRSENGDAEAHAIPGSVEAEWLLCWEGGKYYCSKAVWRGKSNKENGRLGMLIDVVDFKSGKVGRGGKNVGRARSVSFASKEGVALGLVG
jgi:hypothetical protein